jgi:hypothetical protein
MLCNILGCNTESNFRIMYYHFNNSSKPFAKEMMRVCEIHAKLISDKNSYIKSVVLS